MKIASVKQKCISEKDYVDVYNTKGLIVAISDEREVCINEEDWFNLIDAIDAMIA